MLLVKQYIYNCKCLGKELNLNSLKNHIKFELKAHKIIISNRNLRRKSQTLAELQNYLNI